MIKLTENVAKILTKEYLIQEYTTNKKSGISIAKQIGCKSRVLYKYMSKFGIEIRKKEEIWGLKRAVRIKAERNPRGFHMIGKFGDRHPSWKGGVKKFKSQYVMEINSEGEYCYQHRTVVESFLGRKLLSSEEVHHINRIRSDNRIENLIAFCSQSAHKRFHKNPQLVKPEEVLFDGRTLSSIQI